MTRLPACVLAQGLPPAAAGRVVFWCGVLLAAAFVLGLAAYLIRKRMMREDDAPLPMGFSLSDLRDMHARGQLSDEEFEHAKRKMVAGTRARLAGEPDAADDDETEPLLNLDLPPHDGGGAAGR